MSRGRIERNGIIEQVTADAEVDITAPFRGIPRLVALVRYVLATSAPNEADWIEWKVGLDLAKPAGRFAVARQIIGFANRHPSRAALHAGGCSYLVVGAEPGNLAGWAPMDHAKVEQAIRPYVGDDGPLWQPYTVQVDGVDVLVLSVEPPALGDPIHTLRKEYSDPTGGDRRSRGSAARTARIEHPTGEPRRDQDASGSAPEPSVRWLGDRG